MGVTLSVETSDLDGVAHVLSDDVGEPLWSAVGSALNDAASCTGMAGDDPSGLQWAAQYESAASRAAQAAENVVNGTFQLAALLSVTAANYARADAGSTVGGPGVGSAGVPAPTVITLTTRFGGAGGGPSTAPFGWSHVENRVRMAWPNGHQGRLHDAAAAWHRSADALDTHANDVELADLGAIRDGLPEWRDIRTACWSLAGHLRDVARVHRSLARACEDFAHHLDVAHSKIEHELVVFLAESAAIEGAGNLLAFFTAGLSELAADGVESARITATVARIITLLTEFAGTVRRLVETLPLVTETAARVSAVMDRLLSVRVVVAEVAGVPGLRVLSIARDGRITASALDATGELGADTRLGLNAAEVGEGGGHYVDAATHIDVSDPATFDPASVEGMSAENLRDSIPDHWRVEPSNSGDGMIYDDPAHRGRQIRIMPGYGKGTRPGLINEGPYAVVSQNGRVTKIPLEGNGVLK